MGMLRKGLPVLAMTLVTGLVSFHLRGQLVVWIAFMHRVAGETGHLPALVAGSFEQTVVFTPRNANHSVGPKSSMQDLRLLPYLFWKARVRWDFGQPDHDRSVVLQFAARPEAKTMCHPVFLIADKLYAMAIAANFSASPGVQPRRVDDGGISMTARVLRITAQWLLVALDVLIRRTVTRLASNSQFGYFSLEDGSLRILQWFAGSGVATNAAPVPDLNQFWSFRILQKNFVTGSPTLILEYEGEWKTELLIPKFTSHPIRLHVVRAGQHIDPLPDSGSLHRLPGRGFGFACFIRLLLQCPNQLPVWIDHFHPELLS